MLAIVLSFFFRHASCVSITSIQAYQDPTHGVGLYSMPMMSTAHTPLSRWTFIGCFQENTAGSLSAAASLASGRNPVICSANCAGNTVFAVQGSTCYCITEGRQRLDNAAYSVAEGLCNTPCDSSYYEGTARHCGGPAVYYSVYQTYDYTHQTAQVCYDPWRLILYSVVACEVVQLDAQGQSTGVAFEWYLHAASVGSGDPQFPYQRPLASMLIGMQYDFINSGRIVGYALPSWETMAQGASFSPTVYTFNINSVVQSAISFTSAIVPFTPRDSSAADFMGIESLTALDCSHDIYYVTFPQVPINAAGFGDLASARVRLYGIDLSNQDGRLVVEQTLGQRLVLLEVNSRSHELFALVQNETSDTQVGPYSFYYVKLGQSSRDSITFQVEFLWQFITISDAIVNPGSVDRLSQLNYLVGATAVDHVSNTSFFISKESTHTSSPLIVQDLNQLGAPDLEGWIPTVLQGADTPGSWLINVDPVIPLDLAAPQILEARYTMDGRNIIVVFSTSTTEGAKPIDHDGDFVPDDIDWSYQQLGLRDCADMFSRATALALGTPPSTTCEWATSAQIRIRVSSDFRGIDVGNILILRDSTVYAYVPDRNAWSTAASGGVTVELPFPLSPPEIVLNYVSVVDLCSSVRITASDSYNVGEAPVWTWSLLDVSCGSLSDSADFTTSVEALLLDYSAGGQTNVGLSVWEFNKDQLEPGCTYWLRGVLSGRWGLSTTREFNITKRNIPAPQVQIENPSPMVTQRSFGLSLQSVMLPSACSISLVESRTLKFEWTAVARNEEDLNGRSNPVIMSDLSNNTGSASLIIPRYRLEPNHTYTFSVEVGYVETWDQPGATSTSSITAFVDRSEIVVNVLGGSRQTPKSRYIVFNAYQSLDPDYPTVAIESHPDWSFQYSCVTSQGTSCFSSVNASTTLLTNVQPCSFGPSFFTDLGVTYSEPLWNAVPTESSAFYCTHPDPNQNGRLFLNVPNRLGALPIGYAFTFTITAFANGRNRSSFNELTVTTTNDTIPDVVMAPLTAPRIVTSGIVRVSGQLTAEKALMYGANVTWSWSFTRSEVNPEYSNQAALQAAQIGQAYLVPENVFVIANELDPNQVPTIFETAIDSPRLVIQPNILRTGTVYLFRLSATVPDPYSSGLLTGYGDLTLITAGSPPVPGNLSITYSEGYDVETQRVLTAFSWTAQDLPLSYMFSYRVNLNSSYSGPLKLRTSAIGKPEQTVWCMKAGVAAENYTVQPIVEVSTPYGASTSLAITAQVLPPADWISANSRILAHANTVAHEEKPMISSCMMMSNPHGLVNTNAEQASLEGQSTSMVNLLSTSLLGNSSTGRRLTASSGSITMTPSIHTSTMRVMQDMAEGGLVSSSMTDFLSSMTTEVTSLLNSDGQTDASRAEMATQSFNTLGAVAFTSATTSAQSQRVNSNSVNVNSFSTGAFFPSAAPPELAAEAVGRVQKRSTDERPPWLPPLPPQPVDAATGDFIVSDSALPPCNNLPQEFRATGCTTHRKPQAPGLGKSQAPGADTDTIALYISQEGYEQTWLSFLNASHAVSAQDQAARALDDEYFANYSAHLGTAERSAVHQAWAAEKARLAMQADNSIILQSELVKRSFADIDRVASNMVRFHTTGQFANVFNFPSGEIKIGKNFNLSSADSSFTFRSQRWQLFQNSSTSYGWKSIKYTQNNPLAFDPATPTGPFLINNLEVYDDNGNTIPVEFEQSPLNIMAERSSFAKATCMYWDWTLHNGLGGWSSRGMFNDDNGCSTTHLSIIGMFLDAAETFEELPAAAEAVLSTHLLHWNTAVIGAMLSIVALSSVLHYWAFKQDVVDQAKPVQMKQLGDGVTKPLTQDDPVYYTEDAKVQLLLTFWNIMRRDHIVIACFVRDTQLKVTRLQKASTLFSALCGIGAVCALLYGERAVDPKHYVEVGIISATITFPLMGLLVMMFSIRPTAQGGPQFPFGGSAAANGDDGSPTLWALPVPESEQSDGTQSEGTASLAARAPPDPAPLPHLPPPRPIASSAPESGGGPEVSLLARAPIAERLILSADLPPAPPIARAPPEPPEAEDVPQTPSPLPSQRRQASSPVPPPPPLPKSSGAGVPPPPPPRGGAAQPSAAAKASIFGGLGGLPPEGSLGVRQRALGAVGDLNALELPGALPPDPDEARPSSAPVPIVPLLAGLPRRPSTYPQDADGSLGLRQRTGALDDRDLGENLSPLDGSAMPFPPVPPEGDAMSENSEATASGIGVPATLGVLPVLPPQPPPGAAGLAPQSLAQANLLRRLRRMYIEKVIQNSERLAYDERVDMKSSIGHPMAHLANVMAHIAVSCYWLMSLILSTVYAVHFSQTTAIRWFYSCLSGWSFAWLVLEVVKAMLSTILELSQFYQRRKMADTSRYKDDVSRFKNQKLKKMVALAKTSGVPVSRSANMRAQGLVPGPPPLPPVPPPPEAWREDANARVAGALPPGPPAGGDPQQRELGPSSQASLPALGDASAG